MVDAPVSGGVLAAAEGSLSFIVGGSERGVERARPLLEAMGKNVMHCGEAGTGCAAKVGCWSRTRRSHVWCGTVVHWLMGQAMLAVGMMDSYAKRSSCLKP